MSEKELCERIDALEARPMYQDETIEQLNATITAQWKQIDVLTRQLAALNERLQEAEANAPAPANERPPHLLNRQSLRAHRENRSRARRTATTIRHQTTGATCLVLPLRGESLAAWLNSVCAMLILLTSGHLSGTRP